MTDLPPEPPPLQSDTGLHCPRCGYNLTAVTSRRCPECGEIFVLTNAQGHLATFPKSKVRANLGMACTALWALGTVVIILSWTRSVGPVVGWVGFAIAGVGWLGSLVIQRRPR